MIGNFELTELNADNLPMEKRKQLAITSVFPGISKYHIAALSVFIDEELQNYNICDLSMQNNRFKEVIKSIALDSPGKRAANTGQAGRPASSSQSSPSYGHSPLRRPRKRPRQCC